MAKRLFDSGVVQSLVEKHLLVKTEQTSLQLDGFDLVLKHQRLPVVSYPFEWSGCMLKEALVLIADLQIELARHGFEIEGNDADPWNILFEACSPRWIDFGSIIPMNPKGAGGHEEFIFRGTEPLKLLARGCHQIARWSLQDFRPDRLEGLSEYSALIPAKVTRGIRGAVTRRIHSRLAKFQGQFNTASPGDFERWRKKILQTHLPAEQKHPGDFPATRRDRRLATMLSELRGGSALLLGNRVAAYAEGASGIAEQVTVFSETESDANALHLFAKKKGLNLHSLLIKAHNPSPGIGVANREFPPASERLAADVLIACGLVESMVFDRWLNFHQIAETFGLFSRKWLLVEFVPAAQLPRKSTADHPALDWVHAGGIQACVERDFSNHPGARARRIRKLDLSL